ncbi:hypothetical protein BT96DRAFT_1049277 [Gymnopus androsaceus JB14]|uniref:DEAD/DEAH-box helicase domain-containing protein n=1 Tax=Gymnopus androsaceus JB14 TaxID=1447944 RepID=A0A6A4H8D4_9AGAR|nr:hypothetical protein BT96DRAFT_1049277 [Gymnopus androsaceus JB14]
MSLTSTEGVNTIVKKPVPKWKDGLRKLQLICIPKILNLKDVFAINATGGSKSALFGIPVLVHLEISQNVASYPSFNVTIHSSPVGVVVMPTKGLASNIVKQLKKDFGIDAFTCTSENISAKHKSGANIVKEITSCQYRIICIDPEHLHEREWYLISNASLFRQNLIFACAEEGHVINEWDWIFLLRPFPLQYLCLLDDCNHAAQSSSCLCLHDSGILWLAFPSHLLLK